MWRAGESVLTCLAAGSLWTIGFVVAPTLFAVLPERTLAGSIAGELFSAGAIVCSVCCVMLLILRAARGARWIDGPGTLVISMLALVAMGEWVVNPFVRAARAASAESFALWHGLSSVLWLGASIAGLALVVVQGRRIRG